MGTLFEPPNTPQRTHITKTLQIDTPINHKRGPSVHGDNYPVPVSRDALMHDLGPTIPQVSFEFFQKNILPPLAKNLNVAQLVATLKKKKVITKDGRWKAFQQDPCLCSNEAATFDSLGKIVDAIIQYSPLGKKALIVDYKSTPNEGPLCEYVRKDNRPDAFMVFRHAGKPKPTQERVYWRDICCPAEFKLKDTDSNLKDDVAKTCWSIYHLMHEDPRRRFIHAFTIENRSMRLWLGNRSEVIVSDAFDFMVEHEKVVHFFLSQLYAKDHELGLDPTMKLLLPVSLKPMYDITVRISPKKTVVYRTKALLNDDNAAALRGRGTRVWDVVKVVKDVVQPEDTGVLKDCWVDEDRMREGDILSQIRDAKLPAARQDALNAILLTVLAHGDVYVRNAVDNTRKVSTRGVTPPKETMFELRLPKSRPIKTNSRIPQSGASSNAHTAPELNYGPAASYYPKTRYRIVFQEKCDPLYKVVSLRTAFKYLAQLMLPLKYLHEAGWVHRDISTGNILIDDSGALRLADFEYAKRLDDNQSSHDFRTGTVYYMATEVDRGQYNFITKKQSPPAKQEPAMEDDAVFALLKNLNAGKAVDRPAKLRNPTVDNSKPLFRHNPLHDMESGWWISLELLINKERSLRSGEDSVSDDGGAEELASSSETGASQASDTMDDSEHSDDPNSTEDSDSADDSGDNSESNVSDHMEVSEGSEGRSNSDDSTSLEEQATHEDDPIGLTDEDRQYARTVFYGLFERTLIMLSRSAELVRTLHRLPSRIRFIGDALLDLNAALVDRYEEIEANGPPVPKDACKSSLYTDFTLAFVDIAAELDATDEIILAPLKPSDQELELYHVNARKACGTAEVNIPPAVAGPSSVRLNNKRGSEEDEAGEAEGSKRQRTSIM